MIHVGEAFDHIAHALGYTDAAGMDPKITPRRVVNDAGRTLYSLRSWSFAKRVTGLGSLVADQTTIDLPLGVASILNIQRIPSDPTFNTWPWSIVRTTQEDIARQSALYPLGLLTGTPLVLYWAPSFERDDVTPIGLALTATVWPTPTQNATDALAITFEAKWEELPSDLDDINDWTLPIPEFAEQFYLSILRETAKGYELDGAGSVEQRLASVRAWPSYDACVQADSRVAPVIGSLRNGAVEQARCASVRGQRNYPVVVNLTNLVNPTRAT